MSKAPYKKPVLTHAEQIDQLKSRGLIIEDESKAIHLLSVISYYRLSGYWYPLLENKKEHIFKEGASFETAFNLYKFDRELRLMIIGELEKIEVAIRSQLIYNLSHEHGAFWFLDSSLFTNPLKHATTLSKIGSELRRGDEEFIAEFYKNYNNAVPPSWMTMEVTSFGSQSFLFQNLKPGKVKRSIAKHFGLSDKVFESWLHSIVYLRNVCAHHSRLWNRDLRIRPVIPRKPRKQWLKHNDIDNDKSYFVLSMILFFLNTINPNHTFDKRFRELLEKYPNVDVFAMGFHENWEEERLWNTLIEDEA